ncbi:uncharacterized protein LOC111634077 isoform X2 [Centruroides sculpturatus]|uniref:uncharacterized protein LOC111634077 isoform X2 n=1 Tax=Centruroides sculpturatus TaxID=218467 RepID=UPI000C6DC508|nr:uncharacterized protein LOC111634077 isoform X2 [Centruroides sculpturatus]
MKVFLIAAFSFLAVFGVVQSFTPDEFEDAVCSIPDKYLLRFLNCTVSRAPKIFQKAVDIVHECVDTFYEVDGKLDALLTISCDNNVQTDKDVNDCLREKGKDISDPDRQDASTMEETVKYCIFQA